MIMKRDQAANGKAVLFDLDGTLVDSAPDIVQTANRLLAELGAKELPFQTIKGFIGRGVPNLVRRSLETSGLAGSVDAEQAVHRFHEHYEAVNGKHSAAFPGVLEGLNALRAGGYRMACVTNKPYGLSVQLLQALELDGYFEIVVGGDSLSAMKPSAEPLLHACREMGVNSEQAWMVGDSEVDVAAARAAGMPVCIVEYGYSGPAGAGALGADQLIASFEQLPAIFQISV